MGLRAVIAVDLGKTVTNGVELLRRLAFPHLEVTLVHVVEPLLADGTFPELGSTHPMTEILAEMRAAGERACQELGEELEGAAESVAHEHGFGDPSTILSGVARKHGADLIVVGSTRKGAFGSLFMGSVTKGLAVHGDRPVLIGKRPVRKPGRLTAVLATDHSPYMARCVERLLNFAPAGLGHVHVLTATNPPPVHLATDDEALAQALDTAREALVSANRGLADRLHAVAPEVTEEVAVGHPNEAIAAAMARTDADLLILGAQGHGFLERLFVGSVALHQVVHEPHDLLLLRP